MLIILIYFEETEIDRNEFKDYTSELFKVKWTQ